MTHGVRFARVCILERQIVHLDTPRTALQCQRTLSTSSFRPVLPLTTLQLATTRQYRDAPPVGGGSLPTCKLNILRNFYSSPLGCWLGAAAHGVLFQDFDGPVVIQRRHKKSRRGRRRETEEFSDDEEDEEDEYEEEDYSVPLNYKQLQVHVKSSRADNILSSGLNIARNQIDQYFYSGKLRLNNEKLLKKSKAMKEGDFADLITTDVSTDSGCDEDADIKVKRVKILKISEDKTQSDNYTIVLRVWRTAFTPAVPEDS